RLWRCRKTKHGGSCWARKPEPTHRRTSGAMRFSENSKHGYVPRPREMSAPAVTTVISIPDRLPAVLRASPAATRACLLAADIAAVLLARFLGASLWSLVNASIGIDNEFDLWMSLWLFLLVYAAFGLYSASGLGAVEELRRIVLGAA